MDEGIIEKKYYFCGGNEKKGSKRSGVQKNCVSLPSRSKEWL